MDYLFPEFDDEAQLEKLRERWRYEAMAQLTLYTPNYWKFKGLFGLLYRFDNNGCRWCRFTRVKKLGCL